jgi:uncharacterized protein YjbI with pentapeptide repeats
LNDARFEDEGDFSDCDFSGAHLAEAVFEEYGWRKKRKVENAVFRDAKLSAATFEHLAMINADFRGAD